MRTISMGDDGLLIKIPFFFSHKEKGTRIFANRPGCRSCPDRRLNSKSPHSVAILFPFPFSCLFWRSASGCRRQERKDEGKTGMKVERFFGDQRERGATPVIIRQTQWNQSTRPTKLAKLTGAAEISKSKKKKERKRKERRRAKKMCKRETTTTTCSMHAVRRDDDFAAILAN